MPADHGTPGMEDFHRDGFHADAPVQGCALCDIGTPNTGDERDREVEHICYVENGRCQYPGCFRRSPQGEDHEAGIEAAVRGWEAAADAGHTRPEVLLRRAIQDYLARVSPSRDGTVAVEDVLAAADRLAERHVEGSHARVVLSSVRPFFEREFGVSERTERIHDQATKENDERRH